MEVLNEKIAPLELDDLGTVSGGMSHTVVDMQTLVIKLDPNESAVTALSETVTAGIRFMGMKIAVTDPQGKLTSAAVELDKRLSEERRCIVRFRLNGFTEAVITSVEL